MALRTADTRTSAAIAAAGGSLLLLAGVLAGCMQQHTAPVATGPTLVPGYGLFFNDDGDSASLAWGRANSDDVQLMFQCRKGSRSVEITNVAHEADKDRQAMMVLTSGQMQSPLPASAQANEEGEGVLATAHAPTSLPALDLFRRTGVISVKYAGRQHGLSASAREKPAVARFFGACERK